jgi:transposase
MVVDTLGHLLTLTVTPADEQERAQVDALCRQVQQATGGTVKLAWADQGYTREKARSDAAERGIDLQVVKLIDAKKGFVLLPRRWAVERSFGWLARFRRLSRNFERMPEVLAGLHFVVFAMLMLPKVALLLASGASS